MCWHLLYGPPQVRGKAVPAGENGVRVMEMIEDIPTIGPVKTTVRLRRKPSRVLDASYRGRRGVDQWRTGARSK